VLSGRRQFLKHASTQTLALAGMSVYGHSSASPVSLMTDEDDLKRDLIFRTRVPRNAEPALPDLVGNWITPNRLFYVRSHAPNPVIDPAAFRLELDGLIQQTARLSLQDLEQKFSRVECTCTLTCAGNRRYEHSKVKPVGGVQWEEGPIGNAVWSGFRLSDVLKSFGLQSAAEHVWFEGLDQIRKGDTTIPFGGSVPVSKVMEDSESAPGVLLATHMNGEPLPADHGFPLRTVVPGYIGARSVKWLGRINVSNRPSPNYYVADAYKLVQQGTASEWDEAAPLYRFIVNSALCAAERRQGNAMVRLSGYALPTGVVGATVAQVEVSTDNGKSWVTADLDRRQQEYCWSLWTAEVPLKDSASNLLIRATDTTGRTQPASVPWNAKGYMYNAWHRVPVAKLKAFER
jgi:sulfite oxidase